MAEDLYGMIFRRKSVRKYDEALRISKAELRRIGERINNLVPLDGTVRVDFRIAKREETTARWGEYCLLLYSEKKGNYLLNAGYMLEQMDLYLESVGIGACWYGMAKPGKAQLDGLDYVIMLAFGKSRPGDFRKSVSEFDRKESEAVWSGPADPELAEAVRLAPSACNAQPWRVRSDENTIRVYRLTSARSIIPPGWRPFFHSIDVGIFLCFLELALRHGGYVFKRALPDVPPEGDMIEAAVYSVRREG